MNRTKIEWTDFTWNPIVGCSFNCDYCFARQQAKRQLHRCILCYDFLPHVHYERLFEPKKRKKPSKIFTVDMGEFFDKKITEKTRNTILSVIKECPQHIFQILTKQPKNIEPKTYPDNCWIGISIDGINKSPSDGIQELYNAEITIRFLSLEPYKQPINPFMVTNFDWVIVGGQTGKKKFIPPEEWIDKIVSECRRCEIPIFIKNNCNYPEKIQEYPTGVNKFYSLWRTNERR